jgi:hypothetical protein
MATRDYVATYNSFVVGGSTARQIDGEVRRTLDNNFETTVVEFDFITTASSDSAFATEVLSCENAFRVPRQDFTLTQAGQTLISLKQSDNTGLDCAPSITKTGDPADTGRSIKYHVRLEFGRPADNTNTSGRRFSTITIDYAPTRQRTVTLDGMFTALSTNGAIEQYFASIAAFASTALTAIDATATWEKIREPKVDQNVSDKFCNFTVVYKEILANQGPNTLDQLELVDPTMLIDVERFSWDSSEDSGFTAGFGTSGISSGGSPGGMTQGDPGVNAGSTSPTVVMVGNPGGTTTQSAFERPYLINVAYSVSVDKTITKDEITEYKSIIRTVMMTAAQTYAGGAGLTMVEDKPEYDPYYNRINSTMQFIAYINNIIERHVTVADRTNPGTAITGLWSASPYDYYDYVGPGLKIRTVLEEFVAIDTYNGAVMAMIESLAGTPPTSSPTTSLGTNWRVLSREPKGTSIKRGISDGGQTNYVASWAIETILQFGNFRSANQNTAGTVNGGVAT